MRVSPSDKNLKRYTLQAVTSFHHKLNNLFMSQKIICSNSRINPNLRNLVYSTGVKYADQATWDEVFQKFQSEPVPSEKRKLMYALTNSRNKDILNR